MSNSLASVLLGTAVVAGCSLGNHEEFTDTRDTSADLVIVNAKVWTGDGSRPDATAFAVRDGRFVYVGDDRTAKQRAGAETRIVDAAGARIIPGIIDAHLHLISGGLQLARLDLRDVADRSAFITAIARRAQQTRPGRWILGGRWSTESWPDPAQPTRGWIDPFTPHHPVLLERMDGHSALANVVALRMAGIDHNGPPDPPGGTIDRDPVTNQPTGILRESALRLVSRLVPDPSPDEMDRALAAAMREANRHGITTVHTMSAWSSLAPLTRARDAGALTLRVRLYVSEDDWAGYIDRVQAYRADDWVRIGGFKQFMDGSLGSRTAYMAEPFADNLPGVSNGADEPRASAPAALRSPGWRGLLTAVAAQEGEIQRLCQVADTAGLDAAFHAIGDQANHLLLDAYEAIAEVNGARAGRRMRIEHAQHLLPGDIPRFAEFGVVASMQPYHKADDGRYAEQAIGAERCRTSYAFRSLLDAGAHLAFGSDWPVVTLNPFKGIHAAVTGRTLDGKLFVPEQNITVEQALRAYTEGGAYAAGDEDRLGRIKVGFLADFVILKDDVLVAEPDATADIRVKQTYVGGKRVFSFGDPGSLEHGVSQPRP